MRNDAADNGYASLTKMKVTFFGKDHIKEFYFSSVSTSTITKLANLGLTEVNQKNNGQLNEIEIRLSRK